MRHPDHTLLQDILAAGDRVCEALERDDIDAFVEATEVRSRLIERLSAYEHPAEVDPDWRATGERLAAQHVRLQTAVREAERRRSETMGEVQQFKKATRSYGAPPRQRAILRHNLSV